MPQAKDPEFERLKVERSKAYDKKEAAKNEQERTWQLRSRAAEKMNRAYEAQDRAFKIMSSAGADYKNACARNIPTLESLRSQADAAHRNSIDASQRSQSAWNSRDGASAKSYSDQAKSYRSERDGYQARMKPLSAEIGQAKERWLSTQPSFRQARKEFISAKADHDPAKAANKRATTEFRAARTEFDRAIKAVNDRRDALVADNKKRKESKRSIAEKAGVPYQYLDDVYVSHKPDGSINIYFGGVGSPDGPGHGHYSIDSAGTVTYRRDPFDPHGAHNFTANQTDYFDAIRTETVFGSNDFGFRCTYKGLPATVETGVDAQTGIQKINIYYSGADGMLGKGHGHAIAYRDDPYTIVSDRAPK